MQDEETIQDICRRHIEVTESKVLCLFRCFWTVMGNPTCAQFGSRKMLKLLLSSLSNLLHKIAKVFNTLE
jgi:hypothetical protein